MKDLHNSVHVARGLSPVAAGTDNTPYVSEIVDRQGFNSLEFLILIGANTDANVTFAVLFEHGDESNMSDNEAVADNFLLGTEVLAGFQYNDDNEVRKIGYVGPKRYCRVTVTPTGNDSPDQSIFMAGCWLLGHPSLAPTLNPPV